MSDGAGDANAKESSMRREPTRASATALVVAIASLLTTLSVAMSGLDWPGGVGERAAARDAARTGPAAIVAPPAALLQTDDGADGLQETLIQAVLEELPPPPAFIRLVRITLEPGASVPLHTHPGPEFGWMEAGTITIRVEAPAVIAPAATSGTPQPAQVAPVGQEFELRPGDQIVYPANVPFTFANTGQEPAAMLTAVVLPAGSGSPPGSLWVEGTPGPEAMRGVASEILGDAVALGWPTPPLALVVDRLALGPGEAIPARTGPVLLSVEVGRFGFSLVDGQFQVSRGDSGPVPNATPGAAYSLGPGDAVFFPGGMTEVPRPGTDGVLVLLRLSILSAAPAGQVATPAASGTPVAELPPLAATATIAAPPGENATETGTTGDPGAFPPGAAVVVTAAGVRLRGAPSTGAGVVAELDLGQPLVVAGPAVEGDGIVWYPVRAADDAAITGFIAEGFLAAAP